MNLSHVKQKLKKILRIFVVYFIGFALVYLAVLLYPSVLFSHQITRGQCTVYSDGPIDENINAIVDDAIARLSRSEFYDPRQRFNIYLCNDLWRFQLFTQGNKNAGAVTHYHLTGNIFFRPSDVPNNTIVPPDDWQFAKDPHTFADRPLSYYFAHELTHRLQSDFTGRFNFSTPDWLTEGYADYIGKGDNFDFDENLRMLRDSAPELAPAKGLYRRYHLLVAYLMDKKGMSAKELYKNPPTEAEVTNEILKLTK